MTGSAPGDLRAARATVLDRPDIVGGELREALTGLADTWLATQLADRSGLALVAVGGYGRREPAAGSDLDLVLLHADRLAPSQVSAAADALWYPIWDAKVGLDHSVRTVDGARAVAAEDLKAQLGLLDARHVAGDAALTAALRAAAYADWRAGARKRLPELVASVTDRGSRHGELAFLLEPDLKESRGGLRDLHAMTAIAAAWVADAPDERVRAAYSWLLDVRGELHRRSSRGSDLLVLQEHAPVARALGVAEPDELMMRVSAAGRTIGFATDQACRRALEATRPRSRWRRGGPVRRPLADGVVSQDGEAHLARDADPAADPVLLLRVAAAAAGNGIPVAPHALERLRAESAPLPAPWPHPARDAFVAMLGAGPAAVGVLEALDQVGLLVRLLPEWGQVRFRPQHNAVHRFTVDRHLVEAAVQAAALTRRVSRPDLLLLGALFHDLGKGYPGDHTDAGVAVVPDVLRRMGLEPADVDVVTALVRHHLLLPETAVRRDLDDSATIERVAAAVGDRQTLELLHALTEADAAATGPAAWNDWKAGLVAELVRRTAAALAGHLPAELDPLDDAQRRLAEARELAVELVGNRLTVVAPDRPGLLWRWAAVASVNRLEIRSADALTVTAGDRRMGVTVLDVSPRFGTLPDEHALTADVRLAYDDAAALDNRLAERERAYAGRSSAPAAPPVVLWDDEASRVASVIEVRAHDRVGLLHRLTRALSDEGLAVQSARVHTLGAEVVDAFYVVGPDGGPIVDAERRAAVESALLAAAG